MRALDKLVPRSVGATRPMGQETWTRVGEAIFCLVVAGLVAYAALWMWPAGGMDRPISSFTLGMLLRIVGSEFLWLFCRLGL
jgi:hypothetical protein